LNITEFIFNNNKNIVAKLKQSNKKQIKLYQKSFIDFKACKSCLRATIKTSKTTKTKQVKQELLELKCYLECQLSLNYHSYDVAGFFKLKVFIKEFNHMKHDKSYQFTVNY